MAGPKPTTVTRFVLSQRIEHLLLMVSFGMLCLTGLPQKYHQVAWGQALLRFLGGIQQARIIHHIFSAMLLFEAVYHVAVILYGILFVRPRPLAMLPGLQDRIFTAICRSLAPTGQFVAFAYIHARWAPTTLRFRRLLFQNFARVETSPIIWQNLPPAYVYSCWRPIGQTAPQPNSNHDSHRHRRRSRPQR